MKIEIIETDESHLENHGASHWLKKAVDVLKTEGIDAVKVEYLAKKMGKTKGSFYHFFKNRDDLLDAILEYYGELFHYQTSRYYSSLDGPPQEKLWETILSRLKINIQDFDLAIRSWSKKDNRAKKKYEEVLLDALNQISGLFVEMGFDEDDALIRARFVLNIVRGDDFNAIQKIPIAEGSKLIRQQYELLINRN